MRYKLLLLGSNDAAIDDIYMKAEGTFDLMTSSSRFSDIKTHVRYFEPDAIVVCLWNENRDSITRITTLKQEGPAKNIPIVIVGDEKDCADFNRQAVRISSLTIEKPISAAGIKHKISSFLDVVNEDKEEQQKAESAKEAAKEAARQREEEELDLIAEEELFARVGSMNDQKTILIVDDDVRMVKVIKRHLEDEYNVATATSGSVALRYLEKKHVDLILLDFMMPEMTGPEVLKAIHARPSTRNIPVLFLTGASERAQIAEALSEKPQGYLLKPVDKDTLMAKIRALVR